jgi:glycosyltransferase involved in cell wall biosynthesis
MVKQTNKIKDRRLRILWVSNSHYSNSGYGIFTRDLLFRLRDDGWPIAEVAFYGLEGNPVMIDGIKVYPKMGDVWGSDSMFHSAIDFKANVVFNMQDIGFINSQYLDMLMKNKIPWIPYLPIDQEPAPAPVLEKLNFAHKIITFSKYGQKVLENHGYASKMIYEGVDTNIFKPMDKIECRQKLGIPQDVFLFSMVAANKENPPRKGFQEVLESFKMFYEKHPEAAILFHTQQTAPGNFPIAEYANHLGIQNRTFFVDPYKSTYFSGSPEIAIEMNACDIYLQPSMTEGFGLTSVEAQSCGKPVIVNNCQSMPELVIPGKTGEICETNYKWWRGQNGYVYTADTKSMYEKMEKIYDMLKANPNKVKNDCRNHILTELNMDSIFKSEWITLLEDLQTDLLGEPKGECISPTK